MALQPNWPESCPYFRPATMFKERLNHLVSNTAHATGELRFIGVKIAPSGEESEQDFWDSRILLANWSHQSFVLTG